MQKYYSHHNIIVDDNLIEDYDAYCPVIHIEIRLGENEKKTSQK